MPHDDCTYTGGQWFCPHTCDDPAHGGTGPVPIFYHGHYYRPGQLIPDDS